MVLKLLTKASRQPAGILPCVPSHAVCAAAKVHGAVCPRPACRPAWARLLAPPVQVMLQVEALVWVSPSVQP